MDLPGKVAFITGSGGGIGKGLAKALLEKGVKVYLNDVDQALGEATLKEFQAKFEADKVRFSVLDVTNDKQFEDVFADAVKTFGRVDIMINNAGIVNEINFDLTIKINVGGVMRGTRIAMEHMRKDKQGAGGRIINICSVHGFQHTYVMPAYCATKHAVRAFTLSTVLQPERKSQGIQLAALCPDRMEVGMITRPLDEKVLLPQYMELAKSSQGSPHRIPMSELSDAMMELLAMEDMSGAMHAVCYEGREYRKLAYTVSSSFTPGDQVAQTVRQT